MSDEEPEDELELELEEEDEEEEYEETLFSFARSALCFSQMRISSVKTPRPIEVKKLSANRVRRSGLVGKMVEYLLDGESFALSFSRPITWAKS